MVIEDYVSFEVAKLLKEKGFNCRCHSHYWAQDVTNPNYSDFPQNWNCASDDWYSRPTLQMAMKWLREVHNCNIEIDTIGQKFLDTLSWRSVIYNIEDDMECYCEDNFKSYEQACEAAIKYCLENLI